MNSGLQKIYASSEFLLSPVFNIVYLLASLFFFYSSNTIHQLYSSLKFHLTLILPT